MYCGFVRKLSIMCIDEISTVQKTLFELYCLLLKQLQTEKTQLLQRVQAMVFLPLSSENSCIIFIRSKTTG